MADKQGNIETTIKQKNTIEEHNLDLSLNIRPQKNAQILKRKAEGNDVDGYRPFKGYNGNFFGKNEGVRDGENSSSLNSDNYSNAGGSGSDTSSHSSQPSVRLPVSPQEETRLNYSNHNQCSRELPSSTGIIPKPSKTLCSEKCALDKEPTPTPRSPSPKESKLVIGKPPKPNRQTSQRNVLPQMPCVSTTGNGPNEEMAADALTPTVPEQVIVHSPEIVGNAFVRQYYTILETSPWLVYRFYQDISKLGRADNNDEVMGCTTTMEAIDVKIQSYGSMKAEIDFVDAQESHNGGVFVLVNGSMVDKNGSRRKFNQGFFLAPQDKGYYVLNDVFRYSEENNEIPCIIEERDRDVVPATHNQENHISELTNGEVNHLNEDEQDLNDLPVEEVKAEVHKELPVEDLKEGVQAEEEEPLAEIVDEVSQESWGVVESSDKAEGLPKKSSYASIVMKDTPATMPSPTHPKSVAKMQDHQAPVSISLVVPPSSSEGIVDSGDKQVYEGKSRSIYCRNLPWNVPVSRVVEVFADFGPVKNGGVQVRHNMNSCFGFVEFETADAAQSAIKASYIIFDGHKVPIEGKKSTATRENFNIGNNRGRYPPGRGGSNFRGDGGRGRGGYGGGRGYGHVENNDVNFGGRVSGGRGYQNRSEGYLRHDQTGNGSGRMNRDGG